MKRIVKELKSGFKTSAKDIIIMLCILVATTAATFSFQIFDQNTDYAAMLFMLGVFLVARMTESD